MLALVVEELAVRFRGWMNLLGAFLAAWGGGWLGPERAAEEGDRKCLGRARAA